jgi:hypothetical protein
MLKKPSWVWRITTVIPARQHAEWKDGEFKGSQDYVVMSSVSRKGKETTFSQG